MSFRSMVQGALIALKGMALVTLPVEASSREFVSVGSGSATIHGVDVDTGVVRFLTTSTITTRTTNALAAAPVLTLD